MNPRTVRDVMAGRTKAEIWCPRKGIVVRRLSVEGDVLTLDAIIEKTTLPLDAPLKYDAWVMDRGSLLVEHETLGMIKFCTEFDRIVYEDDSEAFIGAPPGQSMVAA